MIKKIFAILATLALVFGIVASTTASAGATDDPIRTYTLNADFDEGVLVGVEYDTVPDQLQLSEELIALPFIWVANSAENTVSKIDTLTGVELGRYRTGPGSENPSRTTVDANGDLWVGNRNSNTAVKIALNPTDLNGDGVINTSTGPGDVKPWGTDEAVLMRISVDYGPRALAVDALNNVWIGGYGRNMGYYDGQTGAKMKNIYIGRYCYGALIDGNGTLWISNQYSGSLTRIDNPNASTPVNPTGTHTMKFISTGDGWVYGIGIDADGYIYTSGWGNNRLRKLNPATDTWVYSVSIPGGASNRGVCVGLDGDVYVAHSGTHRVTRHNASDGSVKATIAVGSTPTGVATDSSGKIWVTNLGSSSVMRIDPATNSVDLTLTGHPGPYNYSDMTGIISRSITTTTGTWTVNYDCEDPEAGWAAIHWTSSEPDGTSVSVRVRSSSDEMSWSAWEAAENDEDLTATPIGQYLQVETTLQITTGDTSPILYDLTVEYIPSNEPPVADAGGPYVADEGDTITLDASGSYDPDEDDELEYRWDLNADGIWDTPYSSSPYFDIEMGDDYSGMVAVEVSDGEETDEDSTTVTFENVDPEIFLIESKDHFTSIDGDDVHFINEVIEFAALVEDPGSDDLTFTWDWGDGTPTASASYPSDGTYPAYAADLPTHTYSEPGTYIVTLTVDDDDEGQTVEELDVIVWGPRDLKEDAIAEIEAIETDNRCVQRKLDLAKRFIERSLSECLWEDETHLNSKWGSLVFVKEKVAVLMLECAKCKEPELTVAIDEIIFKLTKADEMLVLVALEDARNAEVQNPCYQDKVDRYIAKAEQKLEQAYGLLEDGKPARAIMRFKQAWHYSQTAIKYANKTGGCGYGWGWKWSKCGEWDD